LQVERRRELRALSRATFAATWQRDGFGVSDQFQSINASHSGYAFQSAADVPVGTIVYFQAKEASTIGCGLVRHCQKLAEGFVVGVELDEATKEAFSLSGLDSINYYEFLQISPHAQNETIQRVYRFLAARYHPDNPETGDPEKFLFLNQAYRILSDPGRRSAYDQQLKRADGKTWNSEFNGVEFLEGIDGELNRRLAVLAVLYRRCRTNINEPRVSLTEMEAIMGFPREYLDFTTWYLRSKGYLKKEDNSDFSLTVLGVDFVEENHQKLPVLNKLLNSARSQESGSNLWGSSVGSRQDRAINSLLAAGGANGAGSAGVEDPLEA
jgi:curved DNA-binding protein CbpA